MKVLGINASPRKKANTQTLVEAVLEGAAERGADTRLVNLSFPVVILNLQSFFHNFTII